MDNVEIKLNVSGIRALLKSAELANVCEKEAKRMTRATGVPYEPDVYVGRNRVNAGGMTTPKKAAELGGKKPPSGRSGKRVSGYWRTGKNGKKIWVSSYRRKK